MANRKSKMPVFTPEQHASNLQSLAHHMNMPDVKVEYRRSNGNLYRVTDRSDAICWFETTSQVAYHLTAKARVRNASQLYREPKITRS